MKINESKQPSTNLAGGHAHEISDSREALRMVTINNLLEDTYYRDDTEELEALVDRFIACKDEDPEFVLKLAAYARQEMYVRDVPQVLLALSANHAETKPFVRAYATLIIDRVDDMMTTLAFNNVYNNGDPAEFGTVPYALKRALSDVIESGKFDTYQYAKYKSMSRVVSLHDVFNVAHPFGWDDSPTPTDGQAEIADRVTKGYKDSHPDIEPLWQRRTWEDRLTKAGQEGEVTADDWRSVIDDMGLMARIRNLRNALELGVGGDEMLGDVSDKWIRKSQVYPFRFYQARKALKDAQIMDTYAHQWLQNAVDVAADNVPDELFNTAVLVDLSGSMSHPVSNHSDLKSREIAALFGGMLATRDASVVAFADTAKFVSFYPLTVNSTLRNQEQILETSVGTSTFAHEAVDLIIDDATMPEGDVASSALPDRVIIFTDFQIWETKRYSNDPNALRGAWERLRNLHPEEPHLYIVDLQSYGDIKLPDDYPNVTRLQGWNERVLDYIWHNENSMLEDIEGVKQNGR